MAGNGSPSNLSAVVLQASGMVAVQASCTPAAALELMRQRIAEMDGCTLEEYALAIVERRARFEGFD